jgi:hypothetical protein
MSSLAVIQEFRDKPSKTHASKIKRSCQHEDCTTVLSVYNLTDYCSIHESKYTTLKDSI